MSGNDKSIQIEITFHTSARADAPLRAAGVYFCFRMKKIIILLVSAIVLHACSESDGDEVIILVKPSSRTVYAADNIYFDINARTVNKSIISVDASSFDAVNGMRHICTLNPDSKIYTYKYQYQIPDIKVDTLYTEFTFTATDNLRNRMQTTVPIRIIGKNTPLQEKSGITLYCPHSGKQDALSLKSCNPLISSVADAENVDIYVYASNNDSKETLSGQWRSMTGLKFSKFNNFDYGSATKHSLESVYSGAVKYDNVTGLQIDDIIFVGSDTTVSCVIKVVGIFDESGFENDRYLINVKTI